MSNAFFVTCPTCGQVIAEGDGVGPPVYTPCGCPTEVDKLKERIRTLEEENAALKEANTMLLNARMCTGGEWPCEMSTHIAHVEAENARMRREVEGVADRFDQLAEQWGDEGVFRRCRERLRAIVREEGE